MDRLAPYSKRKARAHAANAEALTQMQPTEDKDFVAYAQVEATLAVAWATIYEGERVERKT